MQADVLENQILIAQIDFFKTKKKKTISNYFFSSSCWKSAFFSFSA